MRRLSIDISAEQHQRIKTMAVLQGKTIKEWVLDKIFSDTNEEDTAWQELMSFLDNRIAAVENGKISTKTPDQIAAEVLHHNKVS